MNDRDVLDLAVIIVNYNSAGLLRNCLESLDRHPLRKGSMAVWVVDNASKDESVRLVREEFPHVQLIANDRNVGFAAANNQAIVYSQSRHALLINPDTEVLESTLDQMLEFVDRTPDAGAMGAQLINPDGSVQTSCRSFPTAWAVFLRGTGLSHLLPRDPSLRRYLMLDWDHAATRVVDWLLGACLWMRRETLDQVGLLDDGFFMYYEDIDWCYRVKEAGWNVYYLAEARITHNHQRASARGINRLTWIHAKSIVRLFRKHRLKWA